VFATSDFPSENPRTQTRNFPYTNTLPVILKKNNTTYKTVNGVKYKCIYCGIEQYFTLAKYIAHLDLSHSDLNEQDQTEIIKDLSYQIARFNKEQKKALKKKTAMQLRKIEKEEKDAELKRYKEKVLSILENSPINSTFIEDLKTRRNIKKIKRLINSQLNKELKQKLKESGIDFYIEPKKKKKKNKPIEEIRSSVRLIYTPMGNKR